MVRDEVGEARQGPDHGGPLRQGIELGFLF